MTNAALMPFVLPRQFTLDGQLLSGGKIFTYKSGTNVPKITYATADKTVVNTNPVILDAAGFAPIFLDVGAYTILVQDRDGIQVEYPIDGVVGAGGSFLGGDESVTLASVIAVETYTDLRNLLNVYDIVMVAGKDQVGDGGQGIFVHQPSATAYDDDGITLSTTAGVVYLREFDGVINPQWFGLKYGGSTDQTNNVLKCQTASSHYGFPVDYAGAVYLASNLTIPANTSMICSFGGAFTTGNTAVTMTFASGAKFSSSANSVFGAKCQPIFNAGCVDAIRLSLMGGTTGDDKIAKWVASSTATYRAILDTSLSTATSFTLPSNMTLDIAGGSITITGAVSIVINNIDYAGYTKFLNYTNATYATVLTISPTIKPEWVGAVGDGVTDDTNAIKIAIKSGRIFLSPNKTYKVTSAITFSTLLIEGEGTLSTTAQLTGTTLSIINSGITSTASTWYVGTNLFATDSVLPSNTWTISGTKEIANCSYSNSTLYPILDGTVGPATYNLHLPLIQNAPILSTDVAGKIYKRGSWVNHCRNWKTSSNIYINKWESSIKYANGVYFLLADASTIYTSTTGENGSWTQRIMPNGGATQPLCDVTWTGQNWVISGNYTILKSNGSNLSSWTFVDLSGLLSSGYIRQIASDGNGKVVCACGGAAGTIGGGMIGYSSDHGATWTIALSAFSQPYSPSSCRYFDGIWVVGLTTTGYFYSSNGTSWTLVNVPQVSQQNTIYGITKAYGNWFFVGGEFSGITGYPYGGVNSLLATSGDITNPTYWNRSAMSSYGLGCLTGVETVWDTVVAVGEKGVILTTDNIDNWTQRYSQYGDNPTLGRLPILGITTNRATDPTQTKALMTGASWQMMLELD